MISKSKCELTVNGTAIRANVGETLIDAGLGGRMVLPHDCCSGQCETCRVTVLSGKVDDFGSRERNTVLACVSTLEGDAEISYDPVPVVRNVKGTVEKIAQLGDSLLEVHVRTRKRVPWLPGQYVRLRFKGCPPRDYSPTFPFDLDSVDEDVLVFHIKIYPGGKVSSRFGKDIAVGHKVVVRGPFGNAYLRRQPEPLTLVSTGTGFAPVWAIAVAAVKGQPERPVRIFAGARSRSGLYMRKAADWLTNNGVSVTLCAGDGDGNSVRQERPSQLLGELDIDEVIYAAGSPSQVDAVRHHALAAETVFYADPFFAAEEQRTWRDWLNFAFPKAPVERTASTGS